MKDEDEETSLNFSSVGIRILFPTQISSQNLLIIVLQLAMRTTPYPTKQL